MHQLVPERSYRFLPVFVGAGILAAVAGFRAAITVAIALFTSNWVRVGMALVIVVVAAVGGAAGGLVYVYLGEPLRRVPIAGPYVAGIATVGSCLAVMFLLFLRIERGIAIRLSETDNWIALVVGTIVGGVVLGHILFRDA